MAGLPGLCRHNIDINGEQATFLDGRHDGFRHAVAVTIRHRRHCVLHQIGAFLVGLFELQRIERGLIVVATPDVVDAAFSANQELVDISRGTPHMSVGGPRIAFLMATHSHTASARPADVASRQRDIHQRSVGAVIIVSPDQPLLVGEHGAAARASLLRLGDPFR